MKWRLTLPVLTLMLVSLPVLAEHWPGWRGPTGGGQSNEKDLPLKWSATENVVWKTPLPAAGNSSPIVWGDRVFITQATEVDMRQNVAKRRGVMCFDRKDGRLLWHKDIPYPDKEVTHGTNPYCSATPVTDGERVIASHGSAGVICYDFQGNELWRRDLGKFDHIWGNAASPVLYGDLVILNCGPGERTFLLAMDKRTGNDVWKQEEPGGKSGHAGPSEWVGSWSTPVISRINGRDELIMSWPEAVKSYDPKTGDLLWTCKGLGKLVYTSPLVTPEVVVAMSGYHGPLLGVKTGGRGDVTATHRLWRHAERIPQRIGSGVLVGEHVYILNENGTLQCLNWKTGETLWTERASSTSWGSIVHADGRLYVTNREGETLVAAAGPTFEVLSKNPLKEPCQASPAISDGQIFIRTYRNLWCVGRKQ
jgi:outer membrane protein assembly factor BamB